MFKKIVSFIFVGLLFSLLTAQEDFNYNICFEKELYNNIDDNKIPEESAQVAKNFCEKEQKKFEKTNKDRTKKEQQKFEKTNKDRTKEEKQENKRFTNNQIIAKVKELFVSFHYPTGTIRQEYEAVTFSNTTPTITLGGNSTEFTLDPGSNFSVGYRWQYGSLAYETSNLFTPIADENPYQLAIFKANVIPGGFIINNQKLEFFAGLGLGSGGIANEETQPATATDFGVNLLFQNGIGISFGSYNASFSEDITYRFLGENKEGALKTTIDFLYSKFIWHF